MALEDGRPARAKFPATALGRLASWRPDDIPACGAGTGRHDPVPPLRSPGQATRRPCHRRLPAIALAPARPLSGDRPARGRGIGPAVLRRPRPALEPAPDLSYHRG